MPQVYRPEVKARGLMAMRVTALLLPVLAAALWGWFAWRDVFGIATRHAEAQAQLVAQYMERMIQTQQVLHQAVRARARTLQAGNLRSESFHRFLAALDSDKTFAHGIMLLDFDSRVIASSRYFPVDVTMGERAYIDAVREGQPLFVDRLKLVPSGADAIVVSAPLRVPGFDGLIVSGFRTEEVSRYLRSIAARPDEAASVARIDGMLLVRNFASEPVMLPETAPGRINPTLADEGHFVATAVTDGVRRVYAFTRVANTPLVANFGVPLTVAWQDWTARAVPVMAFFIVMSMLGFLAISRIRRDMEDRFEAEANRKRMEEAERLAEERIRLMRETNHRVKNNLALVVSLINMQMRGKGGIDGNELKTRIGAISHVHDLMYQAADGVHVDIGGLLRDIANSPALVPAEKGLTVDCDIESGILLGPDRTTPLALIVAELVTNAVKHAFRDGQKGNIRVGLWRDGNGVRLMVSDDGVGLAGQTSRKSGSAIVEALVAQLGGKLERNTGQGASFTLTFPTS